MIVNIILCILFALQIVLLLTLTIIRNCEIDKEIKKSDDLFNYWNKFYLELDELIKKTEDNND